MTISLRDHFAGEVLGSVYSEYTKGKNPEFFRQPSFIAKRCYEMADAMIAERDASSPKPEFKYSGLSDDEIEEGFKRNLEALRKADKAPEASTAVFRNDQYIGENYMMKAGPMVVLPVADKRALWEELAVDAGKLLVNERKWTLSEENKQLLAECIKSHELILEKMRRNEVKFDLHNLLREAENRKTGDNISWEMARFIRLSGVDFPNVGQIALVGAILDAINGKGKP